MGDGDCIKLLPFTDLFEKTITDIPKRLLIFPDGVFRMKDKKRNPIFRTGVPYKELILIGIRFSDAVIHMCDPESKTEFVS